MQLRSGCSCNCARDANATALGMQMQLRTGCGCNGAREADATARRMQEVEAPQDAAATAHGM